MPGFWDDPEEGGIGKGELHARAEDAPDFVFKFLDIDGLEKNRPPGARGIFGSCAGRPLTGR